MMSLPRTTSMQRSLIVDRLKKKKQTYSLPKSMKITYNVKRKSKDFKLIPGDYSYTKYSSKSVLITIIFSFGRGITWEFNRSL